MHGSCLPGWQLEAGANRLPEPLPVGLLRLEPLELGRDHRLSWLCLRLGAAWQCVGSR